MSKLTDEFDDLFGGLDLPTDKKTKSKTSKELTRSDQEEDFFETFERGKVKQDSKFSRQNAETDDFLDDDDRLNRFSASNTYVPSFGGTGGILTNTFSAHGTTERILDRTRPQTASGSADADDPFASLLGKPSSMTESRKPSKQVSFKDAEYERPSTAPSSANAFKNQPRDSILSSLTTDFDGKVSEKKPTPSKTTKESSSEKNWLGFDSDDDESPVDEPLPLRGSSSNTHNNKLAPAQQTPQNPVEAAKKSKVDSFLEQDRLDLNQKSFTPSPAVKQPKNFIEALFQKPPVSTPAPMNKTNETMSTLTKSLKSSIDFKTDSDSGTRERDVLFGTDASNVFTSRSNASTGNFDHKRLEFENNELKMTIEHIKRQHEIEMKIRDEGYQHRIEYLEQSCGRREAKLKEENEHLLRQLKDRTKEYENEKAALIVDHQQRLEDLQRDRMNELENLRNLQRQTVDHLRREHEQTIQRLKQLKQEEISTALDMTTHTRAFETVVDHMEQNAKSIDELRLKLEAKHIAGLTDKEIEARNKEHQLKVYEERLQMQSVEFERERKNLQDLISRLEVHLSEQTKLVEEERWKALQAQKRMEAMQDALNGEQRLFMEKVTRERTEIQRQKEQILEDQKIALTSIYESRSQLAEERAKVEALQKTYQEQKHRDMLQTATIDAETRAQQKLAAEQMARLEKREQELGQREEALLFERRSINELKQKLEIDQNKFKSEYEDLQRKSADLERIREQLNKEKERVSQMSLELHMLDGKNAGRLQQLQQSLNNLRQQEEQMSGQYSRMSTNQPIRSMKKSQQAIDSGFSTMQLPVNTSLLPINVQRMSDDESALLRSLRMNALRDQLYIQDEMAFLQNLSTATSRRASRSVSLSNAHRQTS